MVRARWGIAIALVLLLMSPGIAQAHARLKSSAPASSSHLGVVPRELRLDFSESPELGFTSVRITGPDGREVALAPPRYAVDSRRAIVASVMGSMVAGSYTVVWQIAGDDGHPIRGQFTFVIAPGAAGIGGQDMQMTPGTQVHHDPVSMPTGESFGSESPAYVFARWLQFVGLLLAIGASVFRYGVLGMLRSDDATAGGALAARIASAQQRAARIGFMAIVLLGVSLLLRLGAQSFAMHGAAGAFDISLAAQMVLNTQWGSGWMVQLAGVLVAGFAYRRAGELSGRWWMLATAGVALAAVSPALSGHAASAPRFGLLAIFADWLHVLAASSWLGTLAVLLLAGLAAAKEGPADERGRFVRSLVMRFSPVALASAGLATVTGVFAAWIHVGTVPNLWGTRYGITLLVKLGVLGVVTLTGFYNWRYVQPRLGTDDATARLRQSASVEVGVAFVVLLITAVLVASPTSMDAAM